MIAKATCGLTNADGGVLVIGMKAESVRKDESDVITAASPVADTSLVESRVLDLIGKLVEPGIVGLEVREIEEAPGSRSGLVVVYVLKARLIVRARTRNSINVLGPPRCLGDASEIAEI